jgi:hypothetical protein
MTERRPNARTRVLRRLMQGPALTGELCNPACGGERFGARIAELRKAGHEIDMQIVRVGCARYTLTREAGV